VLTDEVIDTSARITCPKCRSLGLPTDCADQLRHEARTPTGENVTRATDGSDDDYWLEVTVRFVAPVSSTLDLDPHQMATHMRDIWSTDDPPLFGRLLADADDGMFGDVDIEVRPVFES
jgi:hypothetical protein